MYFNLSLDGRLHITTPIDSMFLILPYLRKAKEVRGSKLKGGAKPTKVVLAPPFLFNAYIMSIFCMRLWQDTNVICLSSLQYWKFVLNFNIDN